MSSCESMRLFLEKSRHLLILCHSNADPDALGCALSIKRHYSKKDVSIRCDGISRSASLLLQELDESLGVLSVAPDAILVLDTSSPALLEGCKDLLAGTDNLAVIDHHATTAFDASVTYRRCATSNAELVWEVLGKPRDPVIRTALIAGIVTDTGHLRYATRDTFATLSEMVGDDINFQYIYTMFREEVSYSQRIALFKALQRMRVVRAGSYIVVKTSIGSFESFIARNILNLGADVAIIVNDKKGQRIVGRAGTRAIERGVDLSAIMHEVGLEFDGDGGGHPPAAGAKNVSDFKSATDRVLDTVVTMLRGKRK
ncbi:MAG TPA: hypothetical protein ENN11_01525 [Methanomicrobia archaeon]|nr:hypothetical protein [Methanomicrobia archaeon]